MSECDVVVYEGWRSGWTVDSLCQRYARWLAVDAECSNYLHRCLVLEKIENAFDELVQGKISLEQVA